MRRHLCWVAVLTLAGCDCGGVQTNSSEGELSFASDLQFGILGVGETITRQAKLKNVGEGTVNLERLEVTGPFRACLHESDGSCGKEAVLEIGDERVVDVTYAPTEANPSDDVNHQGDVAAVNDSPKKPRVSIHLVGHAVPSRLAVSPLALEFGDLEVGLTKEIALTLENRGVEAITISEATLDSKVFTTDLAKLKGTLDRGAKVSVNVVYAPTAGQADAATLKLVTDVALQKEIQLPASGKGLLAKVSFCFGFLGEAQTCLPDAQGRLAGELDFGALDAKVVKKATVTLKNEGNVQVDLLGMAAGGAMASDETARKNPCKLTPAPPADFTFLPAAFASKLPEDVPNAPLTQSMEIQYSPTSACQDDLTDRGVVSLKAGASAKSPTFFLDLKGYSKVGLVKADNVFWDVKDVVVKDYKVFNIGPGVLGVTNVEMTEGPGTRDCNEGCATRVPCSASALPECALFAWDSGPNPVQIPGAVSPGTTDAVVGKVRYTPGVLCGSVGAPDGGTCFDSQTLRVCMRISSTDPYRPKICGELKGRTF